MDAKRRQPQPYSFFNPKYKCVVRQTHHQRVQLCSIYTYNCNCSVGSSLIQDLRRLCWRWFFLSSSKPLFLTADNCRRCFFLFLLCVCVWCICTHLHPHQRAIYYVYILCAFFFGSSKCVINQTLTIKILELCILRSNGSMKLAQYDAFARYTDL